jgi:acetyl-CoA carboxylase carboxyl transferase subunit alpha
MADEEEDPLQEATAEALTQPVDNPSWHRVQLARHPKRPHSRDYIQNLLTGFEELHGDRFFGDDPSIIGGMGFFEGKPVMIVAQQKGRDTKEKLLRNFGMPKPEGYRKALRLMQLAAKFLENAYYSVISPESCAAIIYRDSGKAPEAAAALRMTAADLLEMKLIDGIIPEPAEGAHLDPDAAIASLRETLKRVLDELSGMSADAAIEDRYKKFRQMGNFFSEVLI